MADKSRVVWSYVQHGPSGAVISSGENFDKAVQYGSTSGNICLEKTQENGGTLEVWLNPAAGPVIVESRPRPPCKC